MPVRPAATVDAVFDTTLLFACICIAMTGSISGLPLGLDAIGLALPIGLCLMIGSDLQAHFIDVRPGVGSTCRRNNR